MRQVRPPCDRSPPAECRSFLSTAASSLDAWLWGDIEPLRDLRLRESPPKRNWTSSATLPGCERHDQLARRRPCPRRPQTRPRPRDWRVVRVSRAVTVPAEPLSARRASSERDPGGLRGLGERCLMAETLGREPRRLAQFRRTFLFAASARGSSTRDREGSAEAHRPPSVPRTPRTGCRGSGRTDAPRQRARRIPTLDEIVERLTAPAVPASERADGAAGAGRRDPRWDLS